MSSLHVSLPDELRAFVDMRTDGSREYSTPSEYVRSLIRQDMLKEKEMAYVYGELKKSLEDIKHGRTYSAEEVSEQMDAYLDELDKEDE